MSRQTLKQKIITRIQQSRRDVFMRQDFEDLGGYDQVGRILKQLIDEEVLLKIGYGLYTKAKPSILDGQPVARIGLEAAHEALRRLGATTIPSQAERDYNSGKSTQVPTGRCIGIKGKRIRRKIGFNGVNIKLERVSGS